MEGSVARYVSHFPNHTLTMHGGASMPMVNTRTGLQELHTVDPKFIKFQNHEFYTADAEEIEFIEKSDDFNGTRGHKRTIEKAAAQDPTALKLMELISKHGAADVFEKLEFAERVKKRQAEKQQQAQEPSKKKKR